MSPQHGGMERTTNQPGSIRAFEFAPLYAKVSGYVKALKVDRGSRVKKGELLMEIFDPELDAAVAQAVANLAHARAQEILAESKVESAEALVKVAQANQIEAKATLESAEAQQEYRNKQLKRIQQLVQSGSSSNGSRMKSRTVNSLRWPPCIRRKQELRRPKRGLWRRARS